MRRVGESWCWETVRVKGSTSGFLFGGPEGIKILGNVVMRGNLQFTFCVSVRPWLYSDMHIWVPFWGPECINILGNVGMRGNPQFMFFVSVRPWLYSDMYIWVPFLGP